MKIIGPVPLNFDCAVTDHIMSYLVQHKSLVNYFRVAYLGMLLFKIKHRLPTT